ncbi:MAG: cyclase family protein [Candidatus Scalindua sp. AMX11]|nr:MAG: cyclase family protein [Candidatus Scalindua sp.]NOG85714.1 cyclase family protein [Planctomycetota bacterium]RZV73203.1 MAG: cyclase family protein [Candidatus Scalindua sp. SCAELEC01]TDE64766.1 MAG: cyclase family protein [Candidatus Scalindua sp. AMX11]
MVISLFLFIPFVYAVDLSRGKWVDMTHEFSEESIYWPTAKTFTKTTVFEGHTDTGFYYSAYNFEAAEHGGTHVDAPVHFCEGGNTVDQISLEQLVGPAVVVDISGKTKNNRNYQFAIDDVLDWEKEYGKVPESSIVLINTGSSKFWPNRKKYMGTDKRGAQATKELAFPGIHPEAATFLAEKRKIKAVGLDTPSIDFGPSTQFKSHQILFEKSIPGFENVANIDTLPATGSIVIALPMKIKGGSGAPLRIVAFVPDP